MMTIDEMKKRKEELMYTSAMISKKAGIPLSTVQKIFCGVTAKPRYDTMEALERVLKKTAHEYDEHEVGAGIMAVREEALDYNALSSGKIKAKLLSDHRMEAEDPWYGTYPSERWPRQGEYTTDDYHALPDDVRVELIDGYIYDMASPSGIHQIIVQELGYSFKKCIENSKSRCLVLLAPFDVRLDGDDKTIVQPDLLIMCERTDSGDLRYEEVPDLIVEVLSTSTRSKDCTIKLRKYMNAGVMEYWIVDPDKDKVLVYRFEEDPVPIQYSFNDIIPIGISSNKCMVDFSDIAGSINEARSWNLPGVQLD